MRSLDTLQDPRNVEKLLFIGGTAIVTMIVGVAVGMLPNPIVVVAAALVVVAAAYFLVRPELTALALVVITFTNMTDVLIEHHGLPSLTIPLVLGVPALVVYRWSRYREPPVNVSAATVALFAYALCATLSFFYARDVDAVFYGFVSYIKNALIAVLTVMLLRGPETMTNVVRALLGCGAFLGTLGVLKYATGDLSNDYGGFAQSALLHIAGDVDDQRLTGPISDPNYFATILVFLVPLAIERIINEKRWLLKVFAGYALVATFAAILLTASRGALLSLAFVSLVAFLVFFRRYWYLLLALIPLGIIGLQLAPEAYVSRIASLLEVVPQLLSGQGIREPSLEGRLAEWLVALAMFGDHPFLGVGVGNYPIYFQEYTLQMHLVPRGEDRHAHSLFLEIAAERGILGVLVFTGLVVLVFRGVFAARRSLLQNDNRSAAHVITAFGFALLSFFTCLTFLHEAYPRFFWMVIAIGIALPQIVTYGVANRRQARGELQLFSLQRNVG